MVRKKKEVLGLFLLAVCLMLLGCSEKKPTLTDGSEVYVKEDNTQKQEETEKEKTSAEEKLFLVTGVDTQRKKITLKGCQEQEEKEYSYTGATDLKDKYGSNITAEKLLAGEMVNVKLEKDTIISVRASDQVFTYGDIHNFTINAEAGTIAVGKNNYYFEEDIQVFYRNNKISIGEISEWDTICLKGIDKKVYAIQVTSGHGTVVLQNTGIFEGGNITIGNVLSLDITPDMKIEVPEGTYLLSVANDGYGGSREVTIEANRETDINLEELKGEGPKYGTIAFVIEPQNAVLYLNGEMVDLSQPLQLKYGRYSLAAKAEGYADWKRTLIVNSESANLKIELKTEDEAESETETTTTQETNTKENKSQEESAREQEEEIKKQIEKIRNQTLSTSNSNSTTGSTSGSN